jgi:hypothetical protein
MKSAAKYAVWLLPLLLAGCLPVPFHKTPKHPQTLAPLIQPSQSLELASIELPPNERLIAGRPLYNMRVAAQPISSPVKHRRPPAPQEIVTPPEVAATPSPAVSAIGELSSGNPADFRRETEESIAAVERGLNGINRNLSDPEQKTANHIREFLKQAKAALASGDVDGAHTLADKAKVLLDELNK